MKRTILQMVAQAAQKYKDVPYTCEKQDQGWKCLSFAEADAMSDQVASGLLGLGFQPQDKIGILSEGRIAWVMAEIGLLKARCVSVPLSIKQMPEEILFRLQHSDSKALCISYNTFDKVAGIYAALSKGGFRFFYFDDDRAALDEKARKMGVKLGPELVLFADLVRQGQSALERNTPHLRRNKEEAEEDDTVIISYTSGTSGNPKGVMLTHLNYYANSRSSLDSFGLPEGLRTLIILPIDHSFGHTVGTYIALLRGFSIYFVDSRGSSLNALKNIPINLKEVSPDFLLTVPALTANLMKKIQDGIEAKGGVAKALFDKGLAAGIALFGDGSRPPSALAKARYLPVYKLADAVVFKKVREIFGSRIQFCVSGGALLDVSQQKFFNAIGVPVYQGYGLSEATPVISTNTAARHKFGSSGPVLQGVECRIVKPDGELARPGEQGEIIIRGENVMKGYYKNPKATQETLRGGWLYTGDMGYLDPEGFLYVQGRAKALLISDDGEKYSPEAIEEAIANQGELIAQVMVYNDHRKFTSALVTLDMEKVRQHQRKAGTKDAKALLEQVKASFYAFQDKPDYKGKFPAKWVPVAFRVLAEPFTEQNMMINSTLKMVRYKIQEAYQHVLDDIYVSNQDRVFNDANLEAIQKLMK